VGVLAFPQRDSNAVQQKITEILWQCFEKHFHHSLKVIQESGAIVVSFPLLRKEEGWSNNKPLESHAQAYINELGRAVSVLNDAEVAHMDLRPSNIMWRLDPDDDSKVQMQIIDLEDAERFGHPIRLWEVLKEDVRYPVSPEAIGPMRASACHNEWFFKAVSAWAVDTFYSSFAEFMRLGDGQELRDCQEDFKDLSVRDHS
jgi:serine/threonine protein kinase